MSAKPIYMPPFQTPAKPPTYSPCNGCGWCCHQEVCAIGRKFFETDVAPCPGIVFKDGKVRCAVVMAEELMIANGAKAPPIKEALGIGTYCDSTDPYLDPIPPKESPRSGS